MMHIKPSLYVEQFIVSDAPNTKCGTDLFTGDYTNTIANDKNLAIARYCNTRKNVLKILHYSLSNSEAYI